MSEPVKFWELIEITKSCVQQKCINEMTSGSVVEQTYLPALPEIMQCLVTQFHTYASKK